MDAAHTDPERRHDFVLLFDVTDGNPNGDPDAGNLPRVDPETMQGLVTDVSLKRRVRNWVDATRGDQAPYRIYVQNKGYALRSLQQEAYEAQSIKSTGHKQQRDQMARAQAWMCQQFFDIRAFGAVMGLKEYNCGQVRGPIQMTFARSIDALVPLEIAITRVAVTRPEDLVHADAEDDGKASGKVSEMGRKSLVPYGLYRSHGFVTPSFARQTGFSAEDLSLFWQALTDMWDLDRSSSRGMTACRGLYVFTHDSGLGNAPADKLFSQITIAQKDGTAVPRRFADYEVSVNNGDMPNGVSMAQVHGYA